MPSKLLKLSRHRKKSCLIFQMGFMGLYHAGEVGATPKLLSSDIKTMGKGTPEKGSDGVSWKLK